MKKIIYCLFLLFIVFTDYKASAQQNLTLYNMESVPQRMYLNPALMPSYSKVYIGLPLLSSEYLNFSNSGFKYSDLIKHRGDSLYVDYDNMLGKLSQNNYFSVAYQPDLLSFGFKVRQNYFSFNATEKVNFRFRYPKNFMEFIWKGNGALLGEEVNLNFGVNFSHYREYGIGFAREIDDKLTVGGKVKYLYGMENVWTERSNVSLTTDPNYFAMTAKSDIKINTSGVDSSSTSNIIVKDYLFKKKNRGVGLDLGGVYKLNDKFTFSASLIDLGFIKWKDGVTNYQSHNPDGEFTYQGMDLNELVNDDSTSNATDVIIDSLEQIFKIDEAHAAYKTNLSTQIYLGTNYSITDKINAGVLIYGQIFDKAVHPGVALSYNQKVGRWLNFSASYSMYNRSYNNFGLGLAFNGPVQFYIASDNVLGAFFPQNTKNLHLHFGINLMFGRKGLDKDKDGIADKKDDCPEIAGLKELKGCPDKDNDGISDKNDLCPDEFGSVMQNGCPDKDGDGVSDKSDECPEQSGLSEFKGCPDKDKDGVIDKEDMCPEEKGLPELKGCPDKDGDKISDKEDDCPEVPGLKAFKGCPDTDGDGVEDKTDLCPDKAGEIINKGCPQAKLLLIDSQGNTLNTAKANKDGSFTFDGIAFDENMLFKLDGENTDGINELGIIIGAESRKAVRAGSEKTFHFEKLKTLETTEVAVILDQKEAEVLKKAFSNLEFATGKDVIIESSYPSLDELAGLMAKKPNWRLKISGHTDNKGDVVANLKLSEKRAEAIKKYLITKGIADSRFKVEWFGSSKPIADNKTEEGRQKNRRVEMMIIE
ncbi:MAG: DUF5723 family protein [Bacteroidetes bacterium]|nr:DUF5723 family protein [Bacteroidota bacterium]